MSRQRLLSSFGALGALLLALIGYEIFVPDSDGADTPAPSAGHAPAPVAIQANLLSSGPEISTWATTILARPLFSISRKPEAAAPSDTAAGDDSPKDLPRLAGIFLVNNAKHAVFQPPGDAPPLVVGEGELVSGWQIEHIGLTSVTLTGPNGQTTLEPKFDENMIPPAPQLPVVAKPSASRGVPPGQPAQQQQPNVQRGSMMPNNGAPQRPGQNGTPANLPFIPPQRFMPQNGVPQPSGAR